MSHEENIKKIDRMSHQDLIRATPHYKRMALKLGISKPKSIDKKEVKSIRKALSNAMKD